MRERRVQANGIRFGVVEAGEGPLALCLHGFPDSAWTWRHLLPELARAGFHAVAPFMRGYAPTELPADGSYQADEPGLHPTSSSDPFAAEHEALLRTPPQPTLYLHGDRDGCLDVGLVSDAERHLAPGSRLEVIEDAGHFLHLERPGAVNERILSWVEV